MNLARALDLLGIFVFALSGASLAARKGFDAVGLVVLALATGLGGGIIRDVLVGIRPPTALAEQAYLLVPVAAALVVLVAHDRVLRLERPVLVFDAAGLGLFAVSGAVIAVDQGLGWAASVFLGTTTAVGGGIVRDVLAREVPVVLRADSTLYAVPAALGAALTVAAVETDLYGPVAATAIAGAVFLVRVLALRFGWRAPTAR